MSQQPTSPRTGEVVGRDPELQLLRDFLESTNAATCLVLSGDPGIGKTTLWEAGLDLARQGGYHVLSARASEAEAGLSFAALADLVDAIDEADLAALPDPQLRALQVALLRADPSEAPPDPFAVCTAFLNAVRAAAGRAPVLIAVDDIQWLDRASSEPLVFAGRRLVRSGVRFLFTRRPESRSELERVLERGGVERVDLGTMSVGAVGRIVADRLGYGLSRRTLHRLHDGAQGNPLLVLELARLLGPGQRSAFESELPLPDVADDVFGARVRAAAEPARRVLLAVALSGGVGVSELSGLVGPLAMDDAVTTGLVVVERSRVRAAHPMLAAAARRAATAAERRALHRELAAVATDSIARAQHLAVAATDPDPALAAFVATAADLASSHGRVWEAVALGEHALRLTPPDDPDHGERVLTLARFHAAAVDLGRMTQLLRSRMSELRPGRQRAHACLLLTDGPDVDIATADALIAQALGEAGRDRSVRAAAYSRRADLRATAEVMRLDEAQAWASKAVAVSSGDAEIDRQAVATLTWTRVLRGQPVDVPDAVERPSAAGRGAVLTLIDRALGVRLAFRGELDAARSVFDRLATLAEDRGELHSLGAIRLQQCEVELRAGHLHQADEFRQQLEEVFRDTGSGEPTRSPQVARLRAVRAAVAGDPNDAARWAAKVLGEQVWTIYEGPGWETLEAHRALGIAALYSHDPATATVHLRQVWDHTRREHVDDPGAFPAAGDLIEALVRSADLDGAAAVVRELLHLARDQDHPWGLATAKRGAAQVGLARADEHVDAHTARLVEAASAFADLGLDFDRARSLLSLGVVQRRLKKRGAARTSLAEAAAGFARCGSSGWAEQARQELDRVSGRRRVVDGQLTATEERVAGLAAGGLSNKEIAERLFVTVNTVEGHLSRVYAKLGVRSRRQLQEHLAPAGNP